MHRQMLVRCSSRTILSLTRERRLSFRWITRLAQEWISVSLTGPDADACSGRSAAGDVGGHGRPRLSYAAGTGSSCGESRTSTFRPKSPSSLAHPRASIAGPRGQSTATPPHVDCPPFSAPRITGPRRSGVCVFRRWQNVVRRIRSADVSSDNESSRNSGASAFSSVSLFPFRRPSRMKMDIGRGYPCPAGGLRGSTI
jgi:hypothetical protein